MDHRRTGFCPTAPAGPFEHLVCTDFFQRVLPEHLDELLAANRALLVIGKDGKQQYVDNPGAHPRALWDERVTQNRVFVLGTRKWLVVLSTDDNGLPTACIPLDQVFAPLVPTTEPQLA